jgi:hypothetical protein
MHGFFVDHLLGLTIVPSPFAKHLLFEIYLTHGTPPFSRAPLSSPNYFALRTHKIPTTMHKTIPMNRIQPLLMRSAFLLESAHMSFRMSESFAESFARVVRGNVHHSTKRLTVLTKLMDRAVMIMLKYKLVLLFFRHFTTFLYTIEKSLGLRIDTSTGR